MVGKQTRKTLLQYLRDKCIPVSEAIELLKKIDRDEKKITGKPDYQKAVSPDYEQR